jgi:branched-chain amino acid transport system substrate-binding protein
LTQLLPSFPTGPNFNPYVFRTSRTSFDDTLVIAKYLVENVGPDFAHIYVDNAFGQGSNVALAYAVAKYGGNLIAPVAVPFETTDFTAISSKQWIAARRNLFLTWSGTGYVTLFQQLTDLGTLDVHDRRYWFWRQCFLCSRFWQRTWFNWSERLPLDRS